MFHHCLSSLYFFWLFLSFLLLDYYLSLLWSLSTLYIVPYHVNVLLCVPVSCFISFFNSVSSLHHFHNLCNLLYFRSDLFACHLPLALSGSYPSSWKLSYS
ncbi:hypothetical protein BDP27DRAFT_1321313 [Rhodocollybia butyracea]|uniref:Uncharacterized protein n=1 Tax=Rhodocollybia butyracea TaxID=206335 RepID=A0A9P5PTF6_9AGAR|nr:hypothetical protein BDP27DRAFT_1321313 [Rhodocollybia butyracea]